MTLQDEIDAATADAVDRLTLELGEVTDGDGMLIDDEAVIFIAEDVEGCSEIKVNAPNSRMIAARIVNRWNAQKP